MMWWLEQYEYLIKSCVGSLKQDVNGLKRLAYAYENEGNLSMSGKEKAKRLRAINEFDESV